MNNDIFQKILFLLSTIILTASLSISSCKVDKQITVADTTGQFFICDQSPVTQPSFATQVSLFINNQYTTNSANYQQPKCFNKYYIGGMVTDLKEGVYNFDLVDNNNRYIEGQFQILKGQCTQTSYTGQQFLSVNYGTGNGTITFKSNDPSLTPTNIFLDGALIGTLNGFTTDALVACGVNGSGGSISVITPPGTHVYKAIEISTGDVSTSSITVLPNSCVFKNISH